MTTRAATAYEYQAGSALPLSALKRRKAQKQRGFGAKSTYGHCIKDKVLIDGCCGSGSFLVQAMVKELADCRHGLPEEKSKKAMETVKKEHIFGIEVEEKAYGLSTTNMLIHGDGNSNIRFGSIFDKDSEKFIKTARPDIILMNPPYNAKPKTIPDKYKTNWGKAVDGKEDPTKGLVFVKALSDIAKEEKWKGTVMAVLLPMSAAIGNSTILKDMKCSLLEDNTLEAVFSLPAEIFYPGASVQACCMVFTLNQPHNNYEGVPNKQTFFGYYKDDGFKKKKNLGRIEQFDDENHSKWKHIEKKWLSMYRNKTVVPGLSAMHAVTGHDEWLCEAYMETDYSNLTKADFQQTVNDYLAYLVKEGRYNQFNIFIQDRKRNHNMSLNVNAWMSFIVGDLFKILNGKGITQEEIEEHPGTFEAVQSGSENNAVMGQINYNYCLAKDYTMTRKPCLSVARSGTSGFVAFHEDGCVVGDSAKILLLKNTVPEEKYVYLFIQTLLMANMFKFNYGRKVKTDLYKDMVLELPVNNDGNPDYSFMADYIKSLPYDDRL